MADRQDPYVSQSFVPQHPGTINITDNDRSSYTDITKQLRLRYTFDDPQIISSFMVYMSYASGYSYAEYHVFFYNASGGLITRFNLQGHLPDTLTTFAPISNVKRVEIQFPNPFTVRLNSFEVYGYGDVFYPKDLTLNPDSRSVLLNWEGVPKNGTGFLHYNIYRDGVIIGTTTNDYYRVTNLEPDLEHSYHVNAQYVNTMSLSTNTVKGKAYDNALKPIIPVAKITEDSVRLSWQGNGAILYELYVNDELLYSGTNLNFDHLNLTTYEYYTYRVDTTDKYNRLVKGEDVTFQTRPPPNPLPLNLEAIKLTYHSATIVFTKRIAPYTITFQDVETETAQNSILLNDLQPLTAYTIKVSYIDEYDRKVEEEITFTTLDIPDVVLPKLEVSNIKVDNARLTWSKVGENYELYLNGQKIVDINTYFYTLSSLSDSTTYTAKVIAIDSFGRRNESNTITFTTLAKPPPRPEPTPPPKVSDSGNVDLDEANDHLVAGANDAKKSSLLIIGLVISIFILVVGSFFLVRVFKKKMAKASSTTGSSSTAASRSSSKPKVANAALSGNAAKNYSSYRSSRSSRSIKNYNPRRRYYVKKRTY